MQSIPYDTWAKEAVEALKTAWGLAQAEQGQLSEAGRETLFKFAPILVARARGIKDREQIQAIGQYVSQQRKQEFQLFPEVKQQATLNFLLAYLQAHMPLDLLDAEAVNHIMKHIIDHYDLPE